MSLIHRALTFAILSTSHFASAALAADTCAVPMLSWGSTGPGLGQFSQAFGVEVPADGNVYVADQLNGRVQVFTENGALTPDELTRIHAELASVELIPPE